MTSTAYDAPVAPAGRDLRMTLTIKAFAPGDEILCRLIDRAVEEIQVGTMYVGKSVLLMGEDRSYVRVAMTDYQQTWDGETAEELDRKERARHE